MGKRYRFWRKKGRYLCGNADPNRDLAPPPPGAGQPKRPNLPLPDDRSREIWKQWHHKHVPVGAAQKSLFNGLDTARSNLVYPLNKQLKQGIVENTSDVFFISLQNCQDLYSENILQYNILYIPPYMYIPYVSIYYDIAKFTFLSR